MALIHHVPMAEMALLWPGLDVIKPLLSMPTQEDRCSQKVQRVPSIYLGREQVKRVSMNARTPTLVLLSSQRAALIVGPTLPLPKKDQAQTFRDNLTIMKSQGTPEQTATQGKPEPEQTGNASVGRSARSAWPVPSPVPRQADICKTQRPSAP
jgi:hypothetical protein